MVEMMEINDTMPPRRRPRLKRRPINNDKGIAITPPPSGSVPPSDVHHAFLVGGSYVSPVAGRE